MGKQMKSTRNRKQLDTEEPPKASTPQVLAALYSHAKAEATYLDGLDEETKGGLADYRRQQLDERMASLKAMFRKTERSDDDLEKLCKEFEDEHDKDDGVVEPGEAGLVEQGQIPEVEEDDLDEKEQPTELEEKAGEYASVVANTLEPGDKVLWMGQTFTVAQLNRDVRDPNRILIETKEGRTIKIIENGKIEIPMKSFKRRKAMKQNQVPAPGGYTEDDPEVAAELDSGAAPFNKAAPGTDEWAEEEAMEPEHKAEDADGMAACEQCGKPRPVDADPPLCTSCLVASTKRAEVEEKAPGGVCMCGMDVPPDATECPGCGAPVEKAGISPTDDDEGGEALDAPEVTDMEAPTEVTVPVQVGGSEPTNTNPATEEILERYQHPKSHKWTTRKHRVSKSLLPFLKFRKAANGRKYLVRSKQVDIEEEKRKAEETLDDSEVKALTTKLAGAIDDLKALVRAKDLPRQYKAGLKHVADQIWYVGKALTDKGKEQKQGGKGSELSDKGKEQRNGGKGSELKDKGEQQGKSPTKAVSAAVRKKFEETLAKFQRHGVLNGVLNGVV